ncbi:unnamed protein product [Linum trigynum]|uniref:Uncharacterized protein n=1 Tax=Linum trigynum TaxID=586398 RepID=A0AAV2GWN2_9ROSI
MDDLITEGIELQHPAFSPPFEPVGAPATKIQPCRPKKAAGSNISVKKKAKKIEINTDEAIVNVSSQLGELKPLIFKAVEALGSITGERDRDGDHSKQAALMKEIGKIEGLTRDQVIDAAMALVDNEAKTGLFYALENEEDRCYFIKNLLR